MLLNRCSSNWTVRVLGRGEFAAFVTYLQIEIVYQLKHRNTSYRLDLHCDRQILVHFVPFQFVVAVLIPI